MRARVALAIAVVVGIGVLPARAQTIAEIPLETFLPKTPLAGFTVIKNSEDVPNGPLTLDDLAARGMGDLRRIPASQRPTDVFSRGWSDRRGHVIQIILWRFQSFGAAEIFMAGAAQGLRGENTTPFSVPIPGAAGSTHAEDDVQSHQVAFQRGRIFTQVIFATADDNYEPSDAIKIAQAQYGRLPSPAAAPAAPPTTGGPDEGFAAPIGILVLLGLLIAGIVVLAGKDRRRRRDQTLAPLLPGAEPAPAAGKMPIDARALASGRRRGRVTIVLLSATGGLAFVAGVINYIILGEITKLKERSFVDLDRLSALDDLRGALGTAWLAATAVTAIAWLLWQHRAQKTLHVVADDDPRFSPAAAVGWWFCPIANLFMPFRSMLELYRGSRPKSDNAVARKPLALPLAWWLTFILPAIAARGSRGLGDTLDEVQDRNGLYGIVGVLIAISAVLATRLIARINQGLEARSEPFEAPVSPGIPPPPPPPPAPPPVNPVGAP